MGGDGKRSSEDRRTNKERRSGIDTRSEEERRLTGERRSQIDRRSGQDRRAKSGDTPKTKGFPTMRTFLIVLAISFSANAFAKDAQPMEGNKRLLQESTEE